MQRKYLLVTGFLIMLSRPGLAQTLEQSYGKPDPYSGTQPSGSVVPGRPEGATTHTSEVSDMDRDSMSLEFKNGSTKLTELQEKGVIDWVNRMQTNKKDLKAHVASWAENTNAAPNKKEQELIDARNKNLEKILEAKGLKVAVNKTPWRCESQSPKEVCNVQLKNSKPSSTVIVFSTN